MEKPVKTRIAPSPTGIPHVGTARTALFNFLFARHFGGKFILRIEDTDRERFVASAEDAIYQMLIWLGLEWDEKHKQSERLDVYRGYCEQLLKEGKARKEDGAIRFTMPKTGETEWQDSVGDKRIKFSNEIQEDFIILKSDGYPTYNFANVIDDHEMGITHVLRGDEFISSTPKHLQIYSALDWEAPVFAHLPVILGSDKQKLSKRHGAASAMEYKLAGYLPEALNNFLALLGWNPGGDREIMSISEMVSLFSLDGVNTASPVFNIEKLEWFNRQYIQQKTVGDLRNLILDYANEFSLDVSEDALSDNLLSVAQPRLTTLSDIQQEVAWLKKPSYETDILIWKGESPKKTLENLKVVQDEIEKIDPEPFKAADLEDKLMPIAEQRGRGAVLWPLRVALSGKEKSPGPFELLAVLGKKESLVRIIEATNRLAKVV